MEATVTMPRSTLIEAIEEGIFNSLTLPKEDTRKLRDFGKGATWVGDTFSTGCPYARCFPEKDGGDGEFDPDSLMFSGGYDAVLIRAGILQPLNPDGFGHAIHKARVI